MNYLHNLYFFNKRGESLNAEKVPYIIVEILGASKGSGALFEVITNRDNEIESVNIIDGGHGYETPNGSTSEIKLLLTDNQTGTKVIIENSDIVFNNNSFEEIIVNLSSSLGPFSYPSFKYEADIYFDEISVDLIENEHIFVLEKIFNKKTKKVDYIYPLLYNENSSYVNDKLLFKFNEDEASKQDIDAIFLFQTNSGREITIEKLKEVEFELKDYEKISSTTTSISSSVLEKNKNLRNVFFDGISESIQVNIGTSYTDEGIFERKLELYITHSDKEFLLGEFYFRSEIEPEDERFVTILDNLGKSISQEEEFIFRNSDINESKTDFININNKRKEFILEYSNIIPYVGSYKGIFNVMNWLGYNDLRFKEYWLNVDKDDSDFGKFKQVEIPFALQEKGKSMESESMLPSSIFKKTNKFGLFYDINRIKSTYDKYGIPEVEDAFMFTQDEVLIKLFALKNYLQKKFIPVNAKIIDIVGEGVYFKRIPIRTWSDGVNIFDIKPTRRIEFSCFPHESLLVDVRNTKLFYKPAKINLNWIENSDGCFSLESIDIKRNGSGYYGDVYLNLDLSEIHESTSTHSSSSLSEYIKPRVNVILENTSIKKIEILDGGVICLDDEDDLELIKTDLVPYINNLDIFSYLKNKPENEYIFNDSYNTEVGAPLLLESEAFEVSWDELDITWNDVNLLTEYTQDEFNNSQSSNSNNDNNVYDDFYDILNTDNNHGDNANIIPGTYIEHILNLNQKIIGINTWETLGQGEFHELKWKITGPRGFKYEKRDKIRYLKKHALLLPYVGEYDVELTAYDIDNNQTNEIHEKCVNVNIPRVKFANITRYGQGYNTLDDISKIKLNDANFMWIDPIDNNETTWDDCDISWDDLTMKNYRNLNESPFPEIEYHRIESVSETDRIIGDLYSFSVISNNLLSSTTTSSNNTYELVINNTVYQSPVKDGDYIYFKRNDRLFRSKILNIIDKDEVNKIWKLEVDNIPLNLNNEWSILRERGKTIKIEGDYLYSSENINGIKKGQWLKLKRDNDIPRYKAITINRILESDYDGLLDNDVISGIVLDERLKGLRKGEKCEIYKREEINSNDIKVLIDGFESIPNQYNDIPVNDKKYTKQIVLQNPVLNPMDKIIPGFHIIKIKPNSSSTNYNFEEQRYLVEKITEDGNDFILDIIEVDSDIGLIPDEFDLVYEYWNFPTVVHESKTQGNETKVELKLNDWPFSGKFLEEYQSMSSLEADWFFDYANINGNFSVEVEEIGHEINVDKNGNEKIYTIIKLNDVNSVLWKTSTGFKFSYRKFNQEFAEENFGLGNLQWNRFNNLIWDDMFTLNWNMMDYNETVKNRFYINNPCDDYLELMFNNDRDNIFKFEFETYIEDLESSTTFLSSTFNESEECGYIKIGELIELIKLLNTSTEKYISDFNYKLYLSYGKYENGFLFDEDGNILLTETGGFLITEEAIVDSNYYYVDVENFDITNNDSYVKKWHIEAYAKNYSGNNLHYITINEQEFESSTIYFENNIHTYNIYDTLGKFYTNSNEWMDGKYGPTNKPAWWNPTTRAYLEWGINKNENTKGWYPSEYLPRKYRDYNDPDDVWFEDKHESVKYSPQSNRIPYLTAQSGPFNWNETHISKNDINIPIGTKVFLSANNCNIAGKSKFEWTILKDNEIIAILNKPKLVWNFFETGNYDIKLKIWDNNGNSNELIKQSYIECEKGIF